MTRQVAGPVGRLTAERPARRRTRLQPTAMVIRRRAGGAAAMVIICASGYASTGAADGSPATGLATTSSAHHDLGVPAPYDLLTHCGVTEAQIDNNYYVASPVLDDGNGNPPPGWGNPYDSGTITINADGTADFSDSAGHRAHFVLRPGATTRLQGCA